MKIQRFLTLVFAAALTAGTCAATPVLIQVYVSGAGNQSVSLSIDGSLIGTPFWGWNPIVAVVDTTVEESDGWHDIAIDYTNISGTSGLTLVVNGGWASSVDLQSLDGAGTPVNGLLGNFFVAGVPVKTIYGNDEGPNVHYSGGSAPWSGPFNGGTFGPTTAFEETLTGKIYFGPDPAPALDTITPPTDPPPSGGSAAPEPAGWWLMAAALPLMIFSRLRLRRAIARR